MEIYIHIPFCIKKCNYCAFNSITATNDIINNYVEALCKEIKIKSSSEMIETVYIGGGTPTILEINQLAKIFEALNKNFDLNHCIEITVEANPGTVDQNYFENLRRLGVNRISLGIQTFNDRLLKIIGRIHNRIEAVTAINSAKKFFENVSIDLMYDLPDQNLKILSESIDLSMNFDIKHISIYGLEIEPNTKFFEISDKLNLPSNDESFAMYEFITAELPKNNFQRYEISNFAKKNFESRHNLGYWSDVNYLGLGAGAHSYDGSIRRSNVASVNDYINGIKNDRDVSIIEEILTKQAAIEEFCFLALRKVEGIDKQKFQKKFGFNIETVFEKVISKLTAEKLIVQSNNFIRLTDRGMQFGNKVFAEFLLD